MVTLKRLRVLYGAATVLWLALAFMMDGMTGGLYWLVAGGLGLGALALSALAPRVR